MIFGIIMIVLGIVFVVYAPFWVTLGIVIIGLIAAFSD